MFRLIPAHTPAHPHAPPHAHTHAAKLNLMAGAKRTTNRDFKIMPKDDAGAGAAGGGRAKKGARAQQQEPALTEEARGLTSAASPTRSPSEGTWEAVAA